MSSIYAFAKFINLSFGFFFCFYSLVWCLYIMAGYNDNGIRFNTENVQNHDCRIDCLTESAIYMCIMISQSRPTEYFKTMRAEKICQLRNNIIRLVFVCIRQVFWKLWILPCVCVCASSRLSQNRFNKSRVQFIGVMTMVAMVVLARKLSLSSPSLLLLLSLLLNK